MKTENEVEKAGAVIGNEAMRMIASFMKKEGKVTAEHQNAAIAAMKAATPAVVAELIADTEATMHTAPQLGTAIVQSAILSLALAGINAVKGIN